jgi:uncharacterized protein YgbK (DUF1537 family)
LTVSAGGTARLREIARQLGFVVGSGSQTGQGNISALLEAIARGDLAVLSAAQIAEVRAEAAKWQAAKADAEAILEQVKTLVLAATAEREGVKHE